MLKHKLIGAVSLAVLMSTGLAACGKTETKTAAAGAESAEQATDDAYAADVEAIEQDATEYAQNELSGDVTEEEKPSYTEDLEAYAAEQDAALDDPNSDAQTALNDIDEGLERAATSLAALTPMQVSDVRSKEDITLVTESAFAQADFNRDGVLDLAEFSKMSMAAAEDQSMIGAVVDQAAEKAGNMVEGAVGTETDLPIGDTVSADDAIQTAAIDEAFAEAAGTDSEMTKDELRSTFLARFEQADINGNDQLEDEERQNFAALTAGKKDK